MSITYILGIHSFFAEKGIGIVWLSLPLFEFKQNFGSSDRKLTVTFPLVNWPLPEVTRSKSD